MFIGHLAVGFASKRVAPRVSLGFLIAAPMFLDLLWPLFLIAGWERVRIDPGNTAFTGLDFVSYPYSHSLVFTLLWSLLCGGIYALAARDRRGGVVLGLGVLSHWVLDWVTHGPDMPLTPGGPRFGLGLWNSIAGTVVIESLMFAAGVAIYLRATRARDRVGTLVLWSLVVFTAAIYVMNAMGPPPPDVRALAWVGLCLWLFPLWAWWADRHRAARDEKFSRPT